MASHQPQSSSSIEEENITICQICEDETKPQWKCLECGLMCQRCRDIIHPKFASAEDHIIINYEENSAIATDPEPKPDLTRIKCQTHSGQNCCFYCKTCQKLVCLMCFAIKHQQHDLDEIQEEYKNRLEKMEKRQKSVEKDMKTLKRGEEFLKKQTKTRQLYYDKIRQEIVEDEKELLDIVKMHTAKLLQELDLNWERFSDTVGRKKDVIEEKLQKSQEQHQGICHLFKPSNAKDVFTATHYDSLFVSVDAKISIESLSSNEVPHYIHGDITKLLEQTTEKLGKLEIVTTLQVEKQYETDLKCISSLGVCSDGCFWICDSFTKMVQKVQPNKDHLYVSVKTNLNISVLYAAVLPSGDLLLCIKGSSNLKLVPSGSTDIQDSVYSVSSLQPVCVHVTCDYKIIVGMKIGGEFEIIVMDKKGLKQVIGSDLCDFLLELNRNESFSDLDWLMDTSSNDLPYYENPINVTSNSEGVIAFLTTSWECIYSEQNRAQVLILDKDLKYMNDYRGQSKIWIYRDLQEFRACDITTSPSDNFVVTDYYNHIIHVLNSEGEFITFYDTFKLGILLPRSLSFSATGQLYIGCTTYEDSEENAKIFEVTGFFY